MPGSIGQLFRNDISNRFSSLPALICLSAITVVVADGAANIITVPLFIIVALEALIALQLIAAWKEARGGLSWMYGYVFIVLFLVRAVFHAAGTQEPPWAFRAGTVRNVAVGLLAYSTGAVALHPAIFHWVRRWCEDYPAWPRSRRLAVFLSSFPIAYAAFSLFSSVHITRDGLDWIRRAVNDNWFEYVREPLTIGLYTLVSYYGWDWCELTSHEAIRQISMVSGLWFLAWMVYFTKLKFSSGFDRVLSWGLLLSSGGLAVLFFGHIEVYPVCVAAMMPTFYFAQRYLRLRDGIHWVGFWYSIAFLMHLSVGWILPALIALPWCVSDRSKKLRDIALLLVSFAAVQSLFWSYMLLGPYQGSVARLLAEFHEQFFVGPDRGMFIPFPYLFSSNHLSALWYEYLYLSIPCLLLAPVAIRAAVATPHRELGFWALAAGGYIAYTLLWNFDRGLPEDWDLFSPVIVPLALFQLHALRNSDPAEQRPAIDHQACLYLASCGTFAFAVQQIWYHHTVPFQLPMFYNG